MLEEESVKRLTMIHGEIDSGSYRSRRVSSNVDQLVDRVLANRFGKQKSRMPWKKMLTVILAIFMIMAALCFLSACYIFLLPRKVL